MLGRIGTYGVCVSALIFWGAGCSAVLGIEELGSSPRQSGASGKGGSEDGGSSGADASAGGRATGGRLSGSGSVPAGGGGTATGGRSNGGAGGSLPDGSVDGSAGAGGIGAGGAGGGGGSTSGGAGGASGGAGGQNTGGGQGGSGGATGSTVNGKVIDFWGHPVPNAIVIVGTAETQTDDNGVFSAANVAGTYDVSIVASWINFDTVNAGWVFQGLTRRDPTLQIDRALTENYADTYATTNGVTFPRPANERIGFAYGSPDGNFEGTIDEDVENLYYIYYYGPATTRGGAHALRWTVGTNGFPNAYKAYDTLLLTVNQDPPDVLFNLALADDVFIGSGTVSGTVTTSASTRENHVYARFADNAALAVVKDTAPSGGNYSFLAPQLTGAGITVAAVAGTPGYFPLAIAHKDDVLLGATGVNLTIPSPQALLVPVAGATTVNANTSFTWSGAAGVSVFTVWIDPANRADTMHIVTAAKTVKLPAFPTASYTIAPLTDCSWFVEQHGGYATVDAAAGSTGFMGSFTHHYLEGSRRGGGTFTESNHRDFKTAP